MSAQSTPLELDFLCAKATEKSTGNTSLILYDIVVCVGRADKAVETAKRFLEEMVQKSIELCMNRIQHRAASRAPAEVQYT
ncbi:hypothetical protein E1A91_A07G218000v1 [Gossypium mustelinum]|uniref:Uncharacterized protein n=1 Tax=Gossypium mustelinum TaxID=34275 RepID=A0A5D2YPF5_GOSMU|nr:hypothetical protein E1A91_A07G218000v1 [Gossypium mustelinum]